MSQPPYNPDPNQQPGYQQPYGAAPPPPPGYGQSPAARPGAVTGAAVIGIVVGALSVLGNLVGIGASFDLGVVPGLLAIVSLALGGLFLYGGIQAMNGKNAQLLVQAAAGSIVLSIITLLVLLAIYDAFAFVGLISLILPIVIIMMMRQEESRQWFRAKGAPTY